MEACRSSIGDGLHHSQQLEVHENVTRWLHLPRPLRTYLVVPATLKPPTHQGLSRELLPRFLSAALLRTGTLRLMHL